MGQRAIVAVLAGGHGRRLGGAKAARLLAGRALISYPLAAARAAGLKAIVIAKHATTLPPLEEPILYEPMEPVHPLCGVLTALDHAAALNPPAAVVLTACDMPFLTAPLLAWLAELDGAAMAVTDGQAQPLLGRCLPEHRAVLRQALAEGMPLIAAIEALAPRKLDASELGRFGAPERLCFNVNEPADLRVAEAWLA